MHKVFNFKSYEDYLRSQWQHAKTQFRTVERKENRSSDISTIKETFPNAKKIICIGARDKSEVISFRQSGFEAIGIDVFSNSEEIKLVDMHRLSTTFEENYFDVAYMSHSFEHSVDPKAVLEGVMKVCKMGCMIILPIMQDVDEKDPTLFEFMKKEEATLEEVKRDLSDLMMTDVNISNFFYRKHKKTLESVVCIKFS
jgi:epoxyqueuosine reductase QueG